MQFIVQRTDKPNSQKVRQAAREAHMEFVQANIAHIVVGGQTFADDAQSILTGNALILDLPDRAALDDFRAQDPYTKAGLFS